MRSSKVADQRRELGLRVVENDDTYTKTEARPIVGILLGVTGVALMVLSFLLPS